MQPPLFDFEAFIARKEDDRLSIVLDALLKDCGKGLFSNQLDSFSSIYSTKYSTQMTCQVRVPHRSPAHFRS